jgi:(1->4)-alpha-D-glucan 1-alpha-D-glucosylmutase
MESSPDFLRDLKAFQRKVAWCGMINSLAQLLLKIASPGTPDFYQGSELWDLRLVDPDNREPVNFHSRCEFVQAMAEPAADRSFKLLQDWPDGQLKMYVTRQALRHRREHELLFTKGDFLPVNVLGPREQHVIAILRREGDEHAMAVVPRWLAGTYTVEERLPSNDFWSETFLVLPEITPGSWVNVLTGARIQTRTSGGRSTLAIAAALERFPVALLSAG